MDALDVLGVMIKNVLGEPQKERDLLLQCACLPRG